MQQLSLDQLCTGKCKFATEGVLLGDCALVGMRLRYENLCQVRFGA